MNGRSFGLLVAIAGSLIVGSFPLKAQLRSPEGIHVPSDQLLHAQGITVEQAWAAQRALTPNAPVSTGVATQPTSAASISTAARASGAGAAINRPAGIGQAASSRGCGTGGVQPVEIAILAAALKCDVDLIFEYVHNNIEYEPIYGSNKGPLGTLLDGRGSDFDQSVLMVALLNAAGYSNTSYFWGVISLTGAQAVGWLGVKNDAQAIAAMLAAGGIPRTVTANSDGTANTVALNHTWVGVQLDGSTYAFDPSYKQHTVINGLSNAELGSALNYTKSQFLSDVGGQIDSVSIRNINRSNLRADLAGYAANLANYIKQGHPVWTLNDVIGGKMIQPLTGSPIRQYNLPYAGSYNVYNSLPDNFRTNLSITMPGQTVPITLFTDQVYGRRITIFSTPAGCTTNCVAQFLVEGAPPATGVNTSTPQESVGFQWQVTATITQPFGASTITSSKPLNVYAGGSSLLSLGVGQVGRGMVEKHRKLLAEARAAGNADNSELVLGESLAMISYSWLAEKSAEQQTADQIVKLTTQFHFGVGITTQSTIQGQSRTHGPSVDMPMSAIGLTPQVSGGTQTQVGAYAYPTAEVAGFFAGSAAWSAFEHGVLEQTLAPVAGMQAASTMRLIDLNAANTGFQNGTTYFADGTTAGGQSTYTNTIRPNIANNYLGSDLTNIDNAVAQGNQVLIPANGKIAVGIWQGSGYTTISPKANGVLGIGQKITGGMSGGFSGTDVSDISTYAEETLYPPPDAQTVPDIVDQSPAASDATVNEPIDAITGAYLYQHDDLVTGGGSFPYALPFSRSYISASSLVDVGIGKGWVHSYSISPQLNSDPYQGMLGPSPIDAASAIAALYVMQDVLSVTPTAQTLTVASMAARWLSDQLTNNALMITWPDMAEEFIQLPHVDGSTSVTYNAPLSSASIVIGSMPDQYGRFTSFSYLQKGGVTLSFGPNPAGQQVAWASLTGWTFPSGMAISVSYDATTGLPSLVRNNLGRSLSFTYSGTAPAHIGTVADDSGRQINYGYDGLGNLTSFIDPLGFKTAFVYDSSGTFDTAGHLTQVYYPSFPLNSSLTNWYDALGRVVQQADANGNASSFYFAGSRSELIDAVGNRHVTYQSARGKVLEDFWVLDGSSTNIFYDTAQSNGHVNVTSNQYDGQDRLSLTIAPEGDQVAYSYSPDFSQNLIQVVTTAKPGSPSPTTKTQSFTYNPTWNRVATATDPLGLVSTYLYDAGGNPAQIIADSGSAPHLNATRSFTYDAHGRVLTATDPVGVVTQYTYNNFEDPISTIADAGSGHLNLTTTLTYDTVGNVTARTDPRGNVTTMRYDAARRLVTTTAPAPFNAGPNLVQTINGYDPDGRVTSVTRSNGAANQVTSRIYSKTGKVLSTIDPNGNQTINSYDAADRLQSLTQPVSPGVNRVTTSSYDAMGRLATVVDNNGNVAERYGYTPNGKMASFTDARGNLTSYGYDGFDRLGRVTYPIGSTGTQTSESYHYDADDNVVSRTTRAGATIAFTYDTLNRLTAKTPPSPAPVVSYGYDLAGRITSTSDNSAAITAAVPPSGSVATYAASTSYDTLNRPTAVSWSPAPASVAPAAGSVTFTHGYNAANQRVSQTATDGSWWYYPTAPPSAVSYTANAVNQYTAVGTVSPTYDANGNLTNDGTFSYTYDAENRLVSASGAGNTASYASDAQGRRKLKTVNGTTTVYVTDADGREVLEYDGASGALQRWYAYGAGPSDVLNQIDLVAGTRTTLIPDIQGSMLATLDSGTGALTKRGYLAYGESASATGSFGYTGQRIDPETNGLYYYRARTYSPVLGRFLQADPVGYKGGKNLYAYVTNDPLNQTDPTGTDPANGDSGSGTGLVSGNVTSALNDITNTLRDNSGMASATSSAAAPDLALPSISGVQSAQIASAQITALSFSSGRNPSLMPILQPNQGSSGTDIGTYQLAACQNLVCGAPGYGVYDPLCKDCYIRFFNGQPITLENGKIFTPQMLNNFTIPPGATPPKPGG